jgi:hypothetical protein
VAGPSCGVGGFVGQGEGEEVAEAVVAEGVGLEKDVGAGDGVEAGGAGCGTFGVQMWHFG